MRPSRQPQVAQEDRGRDDECRHAQTDCRRHPGPEDGVETDAAEPQRVGPQVDAHTEQQEDEDDRGHDDEEPDPPAGPRSPAGTTVVGTAGAAPRWSPAAATPRVVQRSGAGEGVGVVDRVVARLRVGIEFGVRGLDTLGVGGFGAGVDVFVGVVGLARLAVRRPRRARILAPRCRFASPEFFHEVVE